MTRSLNLARELYQDHTTVSHHNHNRPNLPIYSFLYGLHMIVLPFSSVLCSVPFITLTLIFSAASSASPFPLNAKQSFQNSADLPCKYRPYVFSKSYERPLTASMARSQAGTVKGMRLWGSAVEMHEAERQSSRDRYQERRRTEVLEYNTEAAEEDYLLR